MSLFLPFSLPPPPSPPLPSFSVYIQLHPLFIFRFIVTCIPASFIFAISLRLPFLPREFYLLVASKILFTCTSSAASLLAASTIDDTLPGTSSSPAEEAPTAPPPHTTRRPLHSANHSLHSANHSHTYSHLHTPSHSRPYNTTHSHSFLNPLAAGPTSGLTSPHDLPHTHLRSSAAHKGLTVIAFATIGGFIAILFLALCARRAIAHCRTPRHTAVLTVAERAQLVREIAEYTESASRRQRHSMTVPPPPPYEHAPSYDSLTPHPSL